MRKINYMILIFALAFSSAYSQIEKEGKGYSYEDTRRIFGPEKKTQLNKMTGEKKEIKSITIKGNKVQTILFNYGSLCSPYALPSVEDFVWNGLGYGFEFGLLAGSEVIAENGDTLHIISDSHVRTTEGDYSPDGSLKWGWLPKVGYADPTQDKVASLSAQDRNYDGKPDSWPEEWYSPGAGKYLWPAFLGDMATAPDEEVYFAIDDYTNYEFLGRYYPVPGDATIGGLGLDCYVRILQFNNPMAEDIVFMVYQIQNASQKDLSKVFFGMFGDPHVGGWNDFRDDRALFIPPTGELAEYFPQRARSMVYSWDDDFKGMGGIVPGYFGWKFLESPSFDNDGIDNDDDGIMDESPFNDKGIFIDGLVVPVTYGIYDVSKYTKVYGAPKPRWSGDEDGDWDVKLHDVGIDGIGPDSKNYPGPDYGEDDGVPSQAFYLDLNNNGKMDPEEVSTLIDNWQPGYKWAGSEPNFGYRDISESDMIGLTGFTATQFVLGGNEFPKNDELMWEWFTKPEIDPHQYWLTVPCDGVFLFSTGPMILETGGTQRFSMAIVLGENLDDLLLNSEISTRILEADYRFAQPPAKPIVRAVPGDGKVTLYWDAASEESIDPLTRKKDFEGYKIYRSRSIDFSDVYKITDMNGVPFLGQALLNTATGIRAQFDLDNEYSGLSEVEYFGRGVRYYLGNNTGLVHEYVDSTVTNGITYYYAVVAYDHGSTDPDLLLPPSETQATIQEDPLTGELYFDYNTLQVTPGPQNSGFVDPRAGVNGIPTRLSGVGTGDVIAKILEELEVKNKQYKIEFIDSKHYNILDSAGVEEYFISKDTVLVKLRNGNLQDNSVEVYDVEDGSMLDSSRYFVNYLTGQIVSSYKGSLPAGKKYRIKYRFYPVYNSPYVNFEDGNNAFDGIRVYVKSDSTHMDLKRSVFENKNISVIGSINFPPAVGLKFTKIPEDWEVRWNNTAVDAQKNWLYPDSVRISNRWIKFPFTIKNTLTGESPNLQLYEPVPSLRNNYRWDWGESFIILPKDGASGEASWQVTFTIDSSKTPLLFPQEGDIFHIKTTKPFTSADKFILETKEASFSAEIAKGNINNIYVVPNPYVAYALSENPGRTFEKRGERRLEFRNLPIKCTIRIYTLTGELVDTIEKDDLTSMATWNLLSSEGMRVAYGVYIYHVDIPGVGEKIGRFAIIK